LEVLVGGRGATHSAAGSAGEHLGQPGGTVDDRGDLRERHGEDVVQHASRPFGRPHPVEDDEQSNTDRVERTMTQQVTRVEAARRWARGIDGPIRPHATIAAEPLTGGAGLGESRIGQNAGSRRLTSRRP
jgi:hypothetical protein